MTGSSNRTRCAQPLEISRNAAAPELSLSSYRAALDKFREDFGDARELPNEKFFLFGMGLRTKLLYKAGTLMNAASGAVIRKWDVAEEIILPHDYSVVVRMNSRRGETRIVEDERGVWIEESGKRELIPGASARVRLPDFKEYRYAKVMRVLHQELLGAEKQEPPFVAMMSNGTSGDVNNNDFRKARPPQKPYEQIRLVADDVAREVQRVMKTLTYRVDLKLSAASTELKVEVRKPSPAEVERARGLAGTRERLQLRTWTEFYAREQLILTDYPDRVSLPLQIFRIGELAVAQWPGEIFAISGLDLKQRSPVKPLFNISLANGWYGYIPPPEQHALGSYETWRGRTSPLATNALPQITDAILNLLEQTK